MQAGALIWQRVTSEAPAAETRRPYVALFLSGTSRIDQRFSQFKPTAHSRREIEPDSGEHLNAGRLCEIARLLFYLFIFNFSD